MKNDTLFFSLNTSENSDYECVEICEDIAFLKEQLQVNHLYWRRISDGELLESEEQSVENLHRDRSAYREKYRLLTPEKIKKIRENYYLNLRDFSEILGVSFSKLAEIEKGAIQPRYLDHLLRLIEDPYALLKLIIEKPQLLKEEVRGELKIRLRKIMVEQTRKNNRLASLLKLDYLDKR